MKEETQHACHMCKYKVSAREYYDIGYGKQQLITRNCDSEISELKKPMHTRP